MAGLGPVRVGGLLSSALPRADHSGLGCSEGQPHTPISGQVSFCCEGISPWSLGKGRAQNTTMYHVKVVSGALRDKMGMRWHLTIKAGTKLRTNRSASSHSASYLKRAYSLQK